MAPKEGAPNPFHSPWEPRWEAIPSPNAARRRRRRGHRFPPQPLTLRMGRREKVGIDDDVLESLVLVATLVDADPDGRNLT